MHNASLEGSDRLDKMHTALWLNPQGATTAQLARWTKSCSVATDISELRKNGLKITCQYEGIKRGRKIYRYILED